MRECPVCGKEVERANMIFTRDCHGITYRLVCYDCWDKLMKKGGGTLCSVQIQKK